MLQEPMIEKLMAMRLHGMADALKTQQQDPAARELSFLDRLAMLIDQQWNWRQNQTLARRLHTAKLRGNACVEEIDFRTARGLDKSVIRGLAQESGWYATTNTCSFSALQAWARAFWPVLWRRKPAAMATRRFTRGLRRCSEIWPSHAPTAACACCSPSSVASTCW